MEIVVTAFYIVVCVLLFALAILIHEFGHFIVALKLGLRVEAFSIGFGKPIWKKTVNGVEYRISPILLGGYVSIPDVDPEGTRALEGASEKEKGEGQDQGEGQGQGEGEGQGQDEGQDQGQGDGKAGKVKIPAWKEILVAVAGPMMNIVLAAVIAVVLSLVPGVRFGELPAVVSDVVPDMPAAKVGIRAGDRILSVGGRAVATWTEMMTEVQISGGRETEFVIERGAETNTVRIAAQQDEVTDAYYIGAVHTNEERLGRFLPDRNPLNQLAWDAGSIFRVLGALVSPKDAKSTGNALGGPVLIAQGLYRQVRSDPWDGLGFLRFINVNLAVLNLLPIPVLDGGLILFALIALVFRRRVPEVVVKYLSLMFMVLLMGLMAFLILRDSWRTWKIHTYQPSSSDSSSSSCSSNSSKTNGSQNATSQSR